MNFATQFDGQLNLKMNSDIARLLLWYSDTARWLSLSVPLMIVIPGDNVHHGALPDMSF